MPHHSMRAPDVADRVRGGKFRDFLPGQDEEAERFKPRSKTRCTEPYCLPEAEQRIMAREELIERIRRDPQHMQDLLGRLREHHHADENRVSTQDEEQLTPIQQTQDTDDFWYDDLPYDHVPYDDDRPAGDKLFFGDDDFADDSPDVVDFDDSTGSLHAGTDQSDDDFVLGMGAQCGGPRHEPVSLWESRILARSDSRERANNTRRRKLGWSRKRHRATGDRVTFQHVGN